MHSTSWVARILMGNPSFPRLECWLTPLGLDISTILSTLWVARHQYLLLGAVKWAAQINKWSKVRRETQDIWAISPSALPKTETQLEQEVCPQSLFLSLVWGLFDLSPRVLKKEWQAPPRKLLIVAVGLRLSGAVLFVLSQFKNCKISQLNNMAWCWA